MRMENESIENICMKVVDFKLLLEAAGIIIHNPSELTEPRKSDRAYQMQSVKSAALMLSHKETAGTKFQIHLTLQHHRKEYVAIIDGRVQNTLYSHNVPVNLKLL